MGGVLDAEGGTQAQEIEGASNLTASSPFRITLVASEFPYPPVHGGRSDVWQRIRAFRAAGAAVQLICWYSDNRGGAPAPEEVRAVQDVVQDLIVLPIDLGARGMLRRLWMLPAWPSHVSARAPSRSQWPDILGRVRQFRPDAIWQDGIWGAVLSAKLEKQCQLPRWVRSHNIEHRYMDAQRKLARSLSQRLRLWLTTVGLERFEKQCLREAAGIFDISISDLEYWRKQGVTNVHWLPPSVNIPAASDKAAEPAAKIGVVYIGNLHTPNNTQGILWFLEKIWPRVVAAFPQAQAVIAGSSPAPVIEEAIQRSAQVRLIPNPVDVWPLYRAASVLINPVLVGSGVNIKSVEMMHMDCPIVSTSVGVGGLPAEMQEGFTVADQPELFAEEVVRALQRAVTDRERLAREAGRRQFSVAAIQNVLKTMGSPAGAGGRS